MQMKTQTRVVYLIQNKWLSLLDAHSLRKGLILKDAQYLLASGYTAHDKEMQQKR